MKFLQHLDCSPYLNYECLRDEDHKITGIQIIEVRLLDLTNYLFTLIDPKNNLHDPMIKINFDILDPDHQQALTDEMMITRYAIHRILTHFKLYSNDPWTFYLDRDYYGEDVEMVYVKLTLAQSIDKYLANLVNKKAHERIELVLKLEYGYLIPSVINKNWKVLQINPDQLYYSNHKHYQQCSVDLEVPNESETGIEKSIVFHSGTNTSTSINTNESVESSKPDQTSECDPSSPPQKLLLTPLQKLRLVQYRKMLTGLTLPRAITIRNPNGQYKVIDGYHRLAGCPADQQPLIIYCEREELQKFRQK